jgi:deoxyribodipyrimidine photo-lyase
MTNKRLLVWLKNDLRLHDHEALWRASREGAVACVYVIDPAWFVPGPLGFARMGSFRYRFLLESLEDMHRTLQQQGVALVVRAGSPATMVPEVARAWSVQAVYTSCEVATEEVRMLDQVEQSLAGIALHRCWMNSLYLPEDIPWPVHRLPDVFTQFRKEVEAEAQVRPSFPLPALRGFPVEEAFALPFFEGSPPPAPPPDERQAVPYGGGETAALAHLQQYIWRHQHITTYKETRNGLIGAAYSSKLSPALAVGALSPRLVQEEVQRFERERLKNNSTYWLLFELLWRDYFRWVMKKYGSRCFARGGLRQRAQPVQRDRTKWEHWRLGTTGVAFVDANMRELLHTGFMSNRGRQVVASYLVHDLKLDWRWGAAWFEHQLIDYDVHSNWLNWAYVAGVGNDPRPNRYFNVERQAQQYDPEGVYQRLWLR